MKKITNLTLLITFIALVLLHVFTNSTKVRYRPLGEGEPELENTVEFEIPFPTENKHRRFTCYEFLPEGSKGFWLKEEKDLNNECIALFESAYLVKSYAQVLNLSNINSFGTFITKTQEKLKSELRRFDSILDGKLDSVFKQWIEEVQCWQDYVNELMEKSANGELDKVARHKQLHPSIFSVYYDPSKLALTYVSLESSLNMHQYKKEYDEFQNNHGDVKEISDLISAYDELFKYFLTSIFLLSRLKHCDEANSFHHVVPLKEEVMAALQQSAISNSEIDKSLFAFSSTDLPLLTSKDKKKLECNSQQPNGNQKKQLIMQEQLDWMTKIEDHVRHEIYRILTALTLGLFGDVPGHMDNLAVNSKHTEGFFTDYFYKALSEIIEMVYRKSELNKRPIGKIKVSNKDFLRQFSKAMQKIKTIFQSEKLDEFNKPTEGSETAPIILNFKANDVLRIKWKLVFNWDFFHVFKLDGSAADAIDINVIGDMLRFHTQLQAIYMKRKVLELWKDLCAHL